MLHTPKEHNTIHNRITMLTTPTADGKVWWVTVGSSPDRLGPRPGPEDRRDPQHPRRRRSSMASRRCTGRQPGLLLLERRHRWGSDTKTGETTLYKPPTPNSGPRRGEVDSQGRVWFAQFRAGKVGRSIGDRRHQRMAAGRALRRSVRRRRGSSRQRLDGRHADRLRVQAEPEHRRRHQIPRADGQHERSPHHRRPGENPAIWIGENHHGRILKVEPLE